MENPIETLIHLYTAALPTEPDFHDEIAVERISYNRFMRAQAYLCAVREITVHDPDERARLYPFVRSEAKRIQHGGEKYAQRIAEIPAYEPPTPEEFLTKFDRQPLNVHKAVCARAHEMAQAHAAARGADPEQY